MRADAMLEKGDLGGCAVWKRILRAVGELQRAEPGPEVRVHSGRLTRGQPRISASVRSEGQVVDQYRGFTRQTVLQMNTDGVCPWPKTFPDLPGM